MIAVRILQIDFLMCNIHIATDYDRLDLFQFTHVIAEVVLPLHSVIKPFKLCLCIRYVNSNEIIAAHIEHDKPSFVVMDIYAHALLNRKRLLLRKYSRSRIALLHSRIPVLMITRHIKLKLSLLHLALLYAEDIRIRFIEEVHEALTCAGSYTINIP